MDHTLTASLSRVLSRATTTSRSRSTANPCPRRSHCPWRLQRKGITPSGSLPPSRSAATSRHRFLSRYGEILILSYSLCLIAVEGDNPREERRWQAGPREGASAPSSRGSRDRRKGRLNSFLRLICSVLLFFILDISGKEECLYTDTTSRKFPSSPSARTRPPSISSSRASTSSPSGLGLFLRLFLLYSIGLL